VLDSAAAQELASVAPQLRRIHTVQSRGTLLRSVLLRHHPVRRTPKVGVITTVYDRVKCLEECRASLSVLRFKDYEHIIVADAPPPSVLARLEELLSMRNVHRNTILASIEERRNDWGISPASIGLSLARGEYVCFLSDDNGYTPEPRAGG
jgi:hypothetical protein